MSFDWNKVTGAEENQPAKPVENPQAPAVNQELNDLLAQIGGHVQGAPNSAPPVQQTPAPEPGSPFASQEKFLEEAAQSGVTPKLNPFALEDFGQGQQPASIQTGSASPTPPPTQFNDFPPVGNNVPPVQSEFNDAAESASTALPPVTSDAFSSKMDAGDLPPVGQNSTSPESFSTEAPPILPATETTISAQQAPSVQSSQDGFLGTPPPINFADLPPVGQPSASPSNDFAQPETGASSESKTDDSLPFGGDYSEAPPVSTHASDEVPAVTTEAPPVFGAPVLASFGAPPVATPTAATPPPSAELDEEKNRILEIFNKAKKPEPKVVEVSDHAQLNSPNANTTSFDAHKLDTDGISKFDGGKSLSDIHIDEILAMAVERKCSDIHFTIGVPPMMRIDGEMQPMPFAPLQPADVRRLLYDALDDDKLQKFEKTHELDFSYPVKGVGRFRVNMFMQRGSVGGVMRVIPQRIPAFEELGLPPIIREMCKRTSGLILVTGPTGSGKSTTIASMIDDINSVLKGHIMTIEDPIEYLHNHKQCIINQREMHSDTYSFHNALRAVLREDPDIILVGELRDLETIEAALTLAETGHLVFGTLHTRNAPATIDRIVDVFPPESQSQIRVLLGNTLEGVVSQQLLPKLGGGRAASIEIMLGTSAIRNLIREGKTHQMQSIIETGGNIGMQTMDAALAELYRSGKCEYDECLMRAIDKDGFGRLARAA